MEFLEAEIEDGRVANIKNRLVSFAAADRHSSNSGKETERFPLLSLTKRPVGNDGIFRSRGRLRRTTTQQAKTACK
jgi:hypothetical protein